MRTTLVIPDPIYKRAKAYARTHKMNLSEVFSEAVAERLTREEQRVKEPQKKYRVTPRSMGTPNADLADRESLYRKMEEE